MSKTFRAEFSALMAQYRDTAGGLGDDHPITRRLWLLVVATAPDWFVAEMHDMARNMSLIPEPTACDDSGQRFYSLDALAAKLGMSPAEAQRQMAALQADAAIAGLRDVLQTKDVRELHRLH